MQRSLVPVAISRRGTSFGHFFSRLIRPSLFVIFLSLVAVLPAFSVETITIGGSGGGLAAVKLLAQEFERKYPGIKISVLPSLGSSGGIKAVLAGAIDIGLSARLLNDRERGAVSQEYARTPFIFAVRKNCCPITSLTSQELADIYAGKMTTWPDSTPIRVVLRPSTEYDNTLLAHISPEMESAVKSALSRQGMIVEITDQESARAIERTPGAIGTITLGQMQAEKRMLTALGINGVIPATKTMNDGTYPYFKTYYLVTKPDVRPSVRQFLEFIYSANGKAILTHFGYLVTSR